MKARGHISRLLFSAGIAVTLAMGMLAAGQPARAAGPAPVGLGTAEPFAVLAGTPAVTNTGPTTITGDLGIHPGASVTGFPPGTVNGAVHAADAVALQAKSDLVIAYNDAAGRTPFTTVAGGTLGGKTLVAGVYNAGGATLDLTGTLTLDGQNDPNSVWIFQATSDLVTASSSSVAFINGGQPCNVFWQVTSSATLGSGSSFVGTIMALTSITMASGVTLNGRALARNGDVTLINDTITRSTCATSNAAPSPSATSAVPNAAMSRGDEAVAPRQLLFVILGGFALLLMLTTATLRRSAARNRRNGGS
ncbi:MAG: ice-binding family protein [Chloroflexota bacterium]|nr:ice-binding family protein [Chloroflexota bacterium]